MFGDNFHFSGLGIFRILEKHKEQCIVFYVVLASWQVVVVSGRGEVPGHHSVTPQPT